MRIPTQSQYLCALDPTPYILHPTSCNALHHRPWRLYLHPTPYTLHPKPYEPHILNPNS